VAALMDLPRSGRPVTYGAQERVQIAAVTSASSDLGELGRAVEPSGAFADAAVVELPVYTPATTEAFATYGVADRLFRAGPAVGRRDGGGGRAGHRAAGRIAKQRRRLSHLGTRPRLDSLPLYPRGPCPAAGRDERF
jgi:hypothetical protein